MGGKVEYSNGWSNRQNVKSHRRQKAKQEWADERARREEKKRRDRHERLLRREGVRDVNTRTQASNGDIMVSIERKSGHARDAEVTARYGILGHISCGRKNRYETEAMAKGTARFLMCGEHTHLYVYHCICCDGWHISHRLMTESETKAQREEMLRHASTYDASRGATAGQDGSRSDERAMSCA